MRRSCRRTGPIRRGSISQRRLPGSHVPPARRINGASSAGQRTATHAAELAELDGADAGRDNHHSVPFPPDRLGRQMHGRMARTCTASLRLVVRPPACSLARTAPCLAEVASGPSRGAFAPIREDDRSFAPPRRPEPRLATKCGGCLGAPLVGSQLAPPRAAAPIAPGT